MKKVKRGKPSYLLWATLQTDMAVKTRIILLISALVTLVFFGAGILIGRFVIKKTSSTDKEDGGSRTGECKEDQFTEAHKAYSEQ